MMGLNLEGVREGQQGIETLSPCVESVAWEKRSDEPLTWFNRFERYRLLGPQRSLEAASQRCAEVEGQRCPKSSRTWCDASRRWQWQERARAWDATHPSPLPGEEEAHRSDARQERLGMISKILKDLYVTLNLADLPNLEPDEARQFLTDASTEDLDAYLRRERSCGRPVSLLHLAVHAGHKGVQLADGKWLSERLLGVQVLLLAGCQGDRIGDWLGVVPFVITIDAAIGHDDAAVLCEHFWIGIRPGSGA
ncbi:MAG: hypothetical protein ACKO4U_10550, partial [Caldilinea sp.]